MAAIKEMALDEKWWLDLFKLFALYYFKLFDADMTIHHKIYISNGKKQQKGGWRKLDINKKVLFHNYAASCMNYT